MLFSMGSSSSSSGGGDVEISAVGEKEIPAKYIPIYKEAGKAYDIAWTLIAAFHKVETNFGTSPSMESYAGAIGHFQFLPETWLGWGYGRNPPKSVYMNPARIKQFGGYGVDANSDGKADPYDIKDAAFACANYVKASGGMENLDKAIFAYNHADWYVEKVKGYYKSYSKGDYTPVGGNGQNSGGSHGNGQFKMPIAAPITVTSPFSHRLHPKTGLPEIHNGIDLVNTNSQTPIMAAMDGTVVYAQFEPSYGNCVVISHSNGLFTLYAHMVTLRTTVGKKVRTGETIGIIGTTGDSTGIHLHFCVTKGLFANHVDPAPYIGL